MCVPNIQMYRFIPNFVNLYLLIVTGLLLYQHYFYFTACAYPCISHIFLFSVFEFKINAMIFFFKTKLIIKRKLRKTGVIVQRHLDVS